MWSTTIICGNCGADASMRYTPSGQAVTNFSVATNRKYTDKNGQTVDETTWFRVSTWGKLAEICSQYVKKGNKVLVEGRLISDPKTGGPHIWQGQNGPGAAFEISASTVRFLGGRSAEASDASGDARPAGEDEPLPSEMYNSF